MTNNSIKFSSFISTWKILDAIFVWICFAKHTCFYIFRIMKFSLNTCGLTMFCRRRRECCVKHNVYAKHKSTFKVLVLIWWTFSFGDVVRPTRIRWNICGCMKRAMQSAEWLQNTGCWICTSQYDANTIITSAQALSAHSQTHKHQRHTHSAHSSHFEYGAYECGEKLTSTKRQNAISVYNRFSNFASSSLESTMCPKTNMCAVQR